jgi:uncharacterized membrane protein YkoI
MKTVTKTLGTMGALGALALGGSALADAASNTSTAASTTTQSSTSTQAAPTAPKVGAHGRHVGANGKEEQALATDVAKKVEAAALAKVKGTVERTETDVDHGSPYEAHVRKADGTQVEVLVNSSFEVTAVNAMGGPGGPGHP